MIIFWMKEWVLYSDIGWNMHLIYRQVSNCSIRGMGQFAVLTLPLTPSVSTILKSEKHRG
jgi:hypothetical protein